LFLDSGTTIAPLSLCRCDVNDEASLAHPTAELIARFCEMETLKRAS